MDSMEILRDIWDTDAKYARSDGTLWCWRKADILPIGWETKIENEVNRASVSKKVKNISNIHYAELCRFFRKCHANAQMVAMADGKNGVTDLIAENLVPLTDNDLQQMANM